MAEIDQYNYVLPKDLIAQHPLPRREDARLMVANRQADSIDHFHVRDLPSLLRPGDCLVLNDTRVVPARLVGGRARTGGRWEGLFLEVSPEGFWRVLSRTRGKLTAGESIRVFDRQGDVALSLELIAKESEGSWIVRPDSDVPTFDLLDRVGRVPLPPYIRKGEMVEADQRQYQTVYASSPGAVAAPTAGLHFTEALLERLERLGIGRAHLTLHVGMGTFRPIESDTLDGHVMHAEWARISEEAVETIQACRSSGGRVIAVGTTSMRVLETASADGTLRPRTGSTDLFIRPGFTFRTVDGLLTNFHLPRTTLLVLVRTFGGDGFIRRAYQEAVEEEYRFYSYGDAMLIV